MEEGLDRCGTAGVRALLTALASALLIVGLLIVSIEMFAVNQGFFESEYAKPELDTANEIGIHPDDLTRVTQTLLDYTTGKLDSLDMQAEIQWPDAGGVSASARSRIWST